MNHVPPSADDLPTPVERELAALYRKLPQAEPSAALDATIRAAAARAVQPAPTRRRGWLLTVASAAALVLAGALAWRVQQQPTPPTPAPEPAVVTPTVPSPGAAAKTADTATAPAERRMAPPKIVAAPNPPANTPPASWPAAPPPAPQKSARAAARTSAAASAPVQQTAAGSAPAAPPAPIAAPATAEPAAPPSPPAPPVITIERSTMSERAPTSVESRVADIRALLHAGRRQAAVDAARDLHRAHPDLKLPADVAALLQP